MESGKNCSADYNKTNKEFTMKKIASLLLIAVLSAGLFAASFKKGQTVYVSKDGKLTETEKSSKSIGEVEKGDVAVVIESKKKKTNIKIESLGISGWYDTKSLTKKKIAKNTSVDINADNIALAGKGSVSAKATKKIELDAVAENPQEEKKDEAAVPAAENAAAESAKTE